MARKTNGTTTTTRRKKAAGAIPPPDVQVVPELSNEALGEVPKNGKPANVVAIHMNVEDQIRRRAYELYLERSARGGSESGYENQDWLMAEREIHARLGGPEQAFGAAAGQVRH